MYSKLRNLGFIAAASALAACSPDVEPTSIETVEIETPIQERSGSVVAEFEGDESSRVHAQFLDLRGISTAQALHALSIWSPDRELNVGACSLRSYDVAASSAVEIEMLDVGAIQIEHLERSIRLEGRRLPELVSGISGVVYGTEESFDSERTSLSYLPGTTYRIFAPGQDLSGFEAQLDAPEIPALVLIAGQPLDELVQSEVSEDLDIEWTPAEVDVDAEVYIEIRPSAGDQVLRCHVEDDGFFSVPAGVMSQLGYDAESIELSIRRAQVVDVSIDELDRAEIIFAATDRARVKLIGAQN